MLVRKTRWSAFTLFFLITAVCCTSSLFSQERETKTGWTLGGIPVLAYNSDIGLTYGALVQLTDFGAGEVYPNYHQKIVIYLARSTEGKTTGRLFYDAPSLLWNTVRVTGKVNYTRDIMLPFYGFNGYETAYHPSYEISDETHPDYHPTQYKSRAYYTQHRTLVYAYTNLQGMLVNQRLNWLVGGGIFNIRIDPTHVKSINANLPPDEQMPAITLFEEMIAEDRFTGSEADGGTHGYLKAGLVYDTRDVEANPMQGIWAEWNLIYFQKWTNGQQSFLTNTIIFRQYFTLMPEKLSLAYRIGYQSNGVGKTPWYLQPFILNSYSMSEGLGGGRTIRGVLQNRVVGQTLTWGNLELRWKWLRTTLLNQNFYAGLNLFFDTGRVLNSANDHLHNAVGLGLRFALNENFIIAVDYGKPFDSQDGDQGFYIDLGYLF